MAAAALGRARLNLPLSTPSVARVGVLQPFRVISMDAATRNFVLEDAGAAKRRAAGAARARAGGDRRDWAPRRERAPRGGAGGRSGGAGGGWTKRPAAAAERLEW